MVLRTEKVGGIHANPKTGGLEPRTSAIDLLNRFTNWRRN